MHSTPAPLHPAPVTEQTIRTLSSAEHGDWDSATADAHGQPDEHGHDEQDENHDDQGVAQHEGQPDASAEHAAGDADSHNP